MGGNLYGDVLYTAWVYLLVLLAAVPLLLKRAARGDSAIAALAVSTLFLEVAVFFTAPALVYRYACPVVVGTILAPTLLPRPKGAHNQRRSAAV